MIVKFIKIDSSAKLESSLEDVCDFIEDILNKVSYYIPEGEDDNPLLIYKPTVVDLDEWHMSGNIYFDDDIEFYKFTSLIYDWFNDYEGFDSINTFTLDYESVCMAFTDKQTSDIVDNVLKYPDEEAV